MDAHPCSRPIDGSDEREGEPAWYSAAAPLYTARRGDLYLSLARRISLVIYDFFIFSLLPLVLSPSPPHARFLRLSFLRLFSAVCHDFLCLRDSRHLWRTRARRFYDRWPAFERVGMQLKKATISGDSK